MLLVAAGDLELPVREEARRGMLALNETQPAKVRNQWLYSENWFVRQGAWVAVALQDWGVSTLELAREAALKVADRHARDRTAAIQWLGQLASNNGIPALRMLLLDDSEPLELRLEALGALHSLDAAEVPLSAWPLALGDAGMRNLYQATVSGVYIAMRHLEAAGNRSLPVLLETLSDSDPLKRMRAAFVLGKLGPAASTALAPLQALEKDPTRYVADEARRSLARIRQEPDPAPVPVAEISSESVSAEDLGSVYRLTNGLTPHL